MPQLRIRKLKNETLVTICDEELLGEKFTEGKLKLEVKNSFYLGEEASVEKCIEALKEATIANLVGSIIKHAIKADIIDPDNVLKIQDVPHAQMARL